MSAGPNRALGFVQNICCHRAQEKLVEGEAVRRHHNQVSFPLSRSYNCISRVAFYHQALNRKAIKLRAENMD